MFARSSLFQYVRRGLLAESALPLSVCSARWLETSIPHHDPRGTAAPLVGAARQMFDVTGVKTAKKYNLTAIESDKLLPVVGGLPRDATNVLKTNLGFVFDFGAFVLWNASTLDRFRVRKALKKAEECRINDEKLVLQEIDILQCSVSPASERPPHLDRDWWLEKEVVVLSSDLSPSELVEYKLAISHALALSIQLAIIEKRVEDIKLHVHALAERGEVLKWRRSKLPHQLALKVCQLRFDASEQPDLNKEGFYWNRPHTEELYLEVLRIQDYNARVRVLMKKLDFCSELVSCLVEEQSTLHSSRLEMIIIALIGFECLQELYHIYCDRLPQPSPAGPDRAQDTEHCH